MTELIRRAVCAVPPGQVATYGDVAELVGCSARQVGRVMATDAADTPWWRVVNASGRLPAHLLDEARRHWTAEGIDIAPDALGVPLRGFRVNPESWAEAIGLGQPGLA